MTNLSPILRAISITGLSLSLLITSACRASNLEPDRSDSSSDSNVRTSERTRENESELEYKDGSYSATGEYGGLPSSITVDVSLERNIITEVEVTPHATNETSLELQQRFAEAVPAVVIGKDIGEVEVGRLAGSSGTPDGFNDAIRQIREQAKNE
ncbi:FMN-binding protein [Terribacillus saccharophilus]|uniref:FMN-binding protein n=1 Tax=Terribacillus saccharophilus TaxID=361277 RepID=UPI001C3DA425|nr:hypothetical protein [Terribacillus saccharophilus]